MLLLLTASWRSAAFPPRTRRWRPCHWNARLFVAPMEWHLDQFVVAEIQRQGLLLVKLATNAQDTDFVMAGRYGA